jgi:hypothetical protein
MVCIGCVSYWLYFIFRYTIPQYNVNNNLSKDEKKGDVVGTFSLCWFRNGRRWKVISKWDWNSEVTYLVGKYGKKLNLNINLISAGNYQIKKFTVMRLFQLTLWIKRWVLSKYYWLKFYRTDTTTFELINLAENDSSK